MKRAWVALLVAALAALVACTGNGSRASPPTTESTTTVPLATSSTTTTLARTDDGFLLRERAVLTVATERLAAPFYIGTTPADVVSGFEYDLAKVIAAKLRIGGVRVVEAPTLALASEWECGCDLVLSRATVTDQRAQQVDFSVPYLTADQAVLVRVGTPLTSVKDGRLLRWGLELHDDTGRAVLADTVKPTTPGQAFLDRESALQALRAGTLDALLLESPLALASAAADPTLVVAGRFRTGEQYAAMLRFGSPNTARINDIISDLESDGTLALLARRYFAVDPRDVPVLEGA